MNFTSEDEHSEEEEEDEEEASGEALTEGTGKRAKQHPFNNQDLIPRGAKRFVSKDPIVC